jgi:hypothetical protein
MKNKATAAFPLNLRVNSCGKSTLLLLLEEQPSLNLIIENHQLVHSSNTFSLLAFGCLNTYLFGSKNQGTHLRSRTTDYPDTQIKRGLHNHF